jgi:hypothetical protein
LYFVFS